MTPAIKACQNCKREFTIEPEDFDFYKKIQVPPPTWCPECRMIRRMLFRNECIWYRRKCDATGKDILSMFSPEKPYKVYANEYWKSDAWDPLMYGRSFNATRPFLTQLNELLHEVPHPNLVQKNMVNSEYANYAVDLKNCYFVGGSTESEDCAYIFGGTPRSRQCFDTFQTRDLESCYEAVDCEKSNGLRFSQNCTGCSDSYLLYDCRNCVSCVGCVGLRNKQFYIFNKSYSKEDYAKELLRLGLGTFRGLEEARKEFERLKLSVPRKFANILKSENVIGDDIVNAADCFHCFSTWNEIEDLRYVYRAFDTVQDGMDAFVAWNNTELFYEVFSISGQRIFYSALIWGGFDIQYSYNCFDCNNIFGCVGLRNKSYCILNKQYSEQEYRELMPRIIAHMDEMKYADAKGRAYGYGEFFPPEFSPFTYNESVAQDYFPKSPEQAIQEGFSWKEVDARQYTITKKREDIPDSIQSVDDSILKDVIECAHVGSPTGGCHERCATAFRIVPQEFQFLKKMNIPLPRLCPICRRAERIRLRNPLRLWHRRCTCAGVTSENKAHENTAPHFHGSGPCPNEFETSYAPERKEIVYCESCYNSEVV